MASSPFSGAFLIEEGEAVVEVFLHAGGLLLIFLLFLESGGSLGILFFEDFLEIQINVGRAGALRGCLHLKGLLQLGRVENDRVFTTSEVRENEFPARVGLCFLSAALFALEIDRQVGEGLALKIQDCSLNRSVELRGRPRCEETDERKRQQSGERIRLD